MFPYLDACRTAGALELDLGDVLGLESNRPAERPEIGSAGVWAALHRRSPAACMERSREQGRGLADERHAGSRVTRMRGG